MLHIVIGAKKVSDPPTHPGQSMLHRQETGRPQIVPTCQGGFNVSTKNITAAFDLVKASCFIRRSYNTNSLKSLFEWKQCHPWRTQAGGMGRLPHRLPQGKRETEGAGLVMPKCTLYIVHCVQPSIHYYWPLTPNMQSSNLKPALLQSRLYSLLKTGNCGISSTWEKPPPPPCSHFRTPCM